MRMWHGLVWTVKTIEGLRGPQTQCGFVSGSDGELSSGMHVPAMFGRHALTMLLRLDDESEDNQED